MRVFSQRAGVVFSAILFGINVLPAQAKTAQAITFNPVPDQILGISPFQLGARASSGLPLSWASTLPAACKVSSGSVILLSVGTCTLTVSQPGNETYEAANPVIQAFTVRSAAASGSFSFGPGSPVALGARPTSLVTADFNRDGFPDIAAASYDGKVVVLLGNHAGGFSPAPNSPFPVADPATGATVASNTVTIAVQ